VYSNSPISGVIITYNEEKNIQRCILSLLDVVSEIIVVDSCSSDKTVEIAKSLGAKVVTQEFLGHIKQKNFAKNLANNSWVLSLDADECLSNDLKVNLIQLIPNLDSSKAYSFNRFTNYCGYWVKYCGWYPDVKVRLFPKNKGNWGGVNPHDMLLPDVDLSIKQIKGDILHYSFYTKQQHIQQIQKFSTLGAKAYFENGKKAPIHKIVFSPIIKFIKSYFIQLGFLDGKIGWQICTKSSYATYLKYKTLRDLWKSKTT
jgi:glycosyltransferase involved in cell wall biosynthesis